MEVGERIAAVRRAQYKLEISLGRQPTLAEVGAEVGLPPKKVADLLAHAALPVSLNASLGEDGGELGDVVEDRVAGGPALTPDEGDLDGVLGALVEGLGDRVLQRPRADAPVAADVDGGRAAGAGQRTRCLYE